MDSPTKIIDKKQLECYIKPITPEPIKYNDIIKPIAINVSISPIPAFKKIRLF